jgi:hypothetical protein
LAVRSAAEESSEKLLAQKTGIHLLAWDHFEAERSIEETQKTTAAAALWPLGDGR